MARCQYLVLVRHGQSGANQHLEELTQDALYYSLCGSDRQVALTQIGVRQSIDVGKKLAGMFPANKHRLKRLFRTDFKRVEETAAHIETALPYALTQKSIDTRLNKRSYGDFWNLTARGVETLHQAEHLRFQEEGHLHYRAPGGGENYFDVFNRVASFVEAEISPCRDNTLVVTHSVVMLAFRRHFEGLSAEEVVSQYEQMALPNAAVLVYRRLPRSKVFTFEKQQ